MKLSRFLFVTASISTVLFLATLVISTTVYNVQDLFEYKIYRTVDSVKEIKSPTDSIRLSQGFKLVSRSSLLEFDSVGMIQEIPYKIDQEALFLRWAFNEGLTKKDEFGIIARIVPDSNLIANFLVDNERTFSSSQAGILYPLEFWRLADSLHNEKFYTPGFARLFVYDRQSLNIATVKRLVRVGSYYATLNYTFELKHSRFSITKSIIFFLGFIAGVGALLAIVLGVRKLLILLFRKMSTVSKRAWLLTLGGAVLFLVLTNPSLEDFKDHGHYKYAVRKYNFLLFSIYEDKGVRTYFSSSKRITYLGIAKNFMELD